MVFILVAGTVLYCAVILFVLFVVLRFPNNNSVEKNSFVSVIIAARNEENRIKPTLESLTRIEYPHEKYEVIFVDDASTDRTAEIIEQYSEERINWKLLRIHEKNDTLRGKKAALKKAVETANGEIILTTDADCIVPKEWISEMVSTFDHHTVMVLGHALLTEKKGWLNKLLQFDNLFSAIIMSALTVLGFPMTSVGRNMAFRKDAYFKSGGYDQLSKHKSGDDVHLTELFRQRVKGKIRFNFSNKSYTLSKPPDTHKEIFFQQIRKNSKILKKSLPSVLLSIFLFGFHLLFLFFPFFDDAIYLWLALVGSKLILEFITLFISAKRFRTESIIMLIPFMQLFYPLYISFLATLGVFQKYEWKKSTR